MSVSNFLARLAEILNTAHIDYMVAGSVASSFHGAPRSTQDIDIVVDLDTAGVKRLLQGLSPDDYYFSEEAALDAARRRGQFNVIDLETGWKADLIARRNRAFSKGEFARRQTAEVLGDCELFCMERIDSR